MLMAPGMVSFSKLAAGRTSMINTVFPPSSCFLSSSAGFGLAPIAHLVCGSTGYLRCSWAKENMPHSETAVMVKPATNDFMRPLLLKLLVGKFLQSWREVTWHSYARQWLLIAP